MADRAQVKGQELEVNVGPRSQADAVQRLVDKLGSEAKGLTVEQLMARLRKGTRADDPDQMTQRVAAGQCPVDGCEEPPAGDPRAIGGALCEKHGKGKGEPTFEGARGFVRDLTELSRQYGVGIDGEFDLAPVSRTAGGYSTTYDGKSFKVSHSGGKGK